MTDFILKIITAIATIDRGCSTCIIFFLARLYIIDPFDKSKILYELNQHKLTDYNFKIEDLDRCIKNLLLEES